MSKPLFTLLAAGFLCLAHLRPVAAQFDDFGMGPRPDPPIKKQPLSEDYVARYPVPASEAAVREKLGKVISVNYVETPLNDVLVHLDSLLDLQILLDIAALTDVGIPTDEPVTIQVDDVTGLSVLELILNQHGLIWYERDGLVIVATDDLDRQTTRTYEVSDLVLTTDADGEVVADMQELIDTIQATIPKAAWEHHDLPCYIDPIETSTINALTIRNLVGAFPQFDRLLMDIREIRASDKLVTKPPRSAKDVELEQRFQRPVDVEFIDTPLSDAVSYFSELLDAQIVIDHWELTQIGLSLDEPVTLHIETVPAKTAFDVAFGRLGLDWIIHHEVIYVTTRVIAEEHLETRCYDVRDLVTYESRSGEMAIDPAPLVDLLAHQADPHNGVVTCYVTGGTPVLVALQNQRSHRKIEQLLNDLRALHANQPGSDTAGVIQQN